jgi:hypothetical protein
VFVLSGRSVWTKIEDAHTDKYNKKITVKPPLAFEMA